MYKISEAKKFFHDRIVLGIIILLVFGSIAGVSISVAALKYFPAQTEAVFKYLQSPAVPLSNTNPNQTPYVSNISYEQAIIDVAKKASPSVVSIVIEKKMPAYEQRFINPFGDLGQGFNIGVPQFIPKDNELREVGAGSGFIVSSDGLVITNKHVVSDPQADYTILTNDGEKYSAKVLAMNPVQDIAIMRIESDKTFQAISLGDSSSIQIGQAAIAIGNALGQFTNTVSVGVVSGLQRTVSAAGQGGTVVEVLEGTIQTDAAINEGNSGGPLLNLKGEVIGISTATAQGAQSVGFAIPINVAKKDINQVLKTNKIVYPFLGVRHVSINDKIKQEYGLPVDYGSLILKGTNDEPAVTAGSAAEKSGIKENDIVLELNGEKITPNNSMSLLIQKYDAGDKVTLKILRDGKEINVEVVLGERTS